MRPLQPAMDALWRPLDVAAVILAAIALYLYLPQLIKINRAKAEQLGGKDFARNLRQSVSRSGDSCTQHADNFPMLGQEDHLLLRLSDGHSVSITRLLSQRSPDDVIVSSML